MMRIAREEGTRRGSFFYHVEDGFHYHLNREEEGVIYFKCIYYEKGCQGRAIFDPYDGWQHSQPHTTHGADALYPDEMALRRRIIARCRTLECTPFRTIINEECRRFPPEVVARVTYARMRNPMREARLRNYPIPPANLRYLSRLLLDPHYSVMTMTDDGLDNIYAGSITDVDGGHHILFSSGRMRERMRDFLVLHSDGTFKTVPVNPDFAAQVFVIVGVWDHHIVTLGWALMASRTEVAYRSVLELIRDLLGPDIALTRAVTDFETGEQNAWEGTFGVIVQGCLWHLCRAFLRNVGENNLVARMRRIPEVRRIIRLTFALPLLPEDFIVLGYQTIVLHARNEGNYVFRIVRPFLLYVWVNWVSRPVKRGRMCVFGSNQRTNNACESHNRMLRSTVGTHPNIYVFIRGLVTLEQSSFNTIIALEEGRRAARARKRTSIMNDARIQQLSDTLFNPPGPIAQAIFRFLRRASHLMDNMIEEAIEAGR